MSQNLFEELQGKKQWLVRLAQKASEFGWIPKHAVSNSGKDQNVISYDEIIDKLDKDTLTIGVIGQMKCGKSTFLNSFVFEDTILPAATTPMTAALSVITYGEKERLVAEFYTVDEWEEQKQQASRSLDDVRDNPLEESKVKAAKELVERASKLGGSLTNYLGKTQEDSFDNLIEYVGADGKYISITKAVTIYYPKEYLKGVEIVDTPGFNDPIVSREERTKEFLKKADVVLMMLYAGRPFDATDRDIIFKNVRECGIGKVLIGINKYDIPYCSDTNPEDENQIKEYVKSELRKACRDCQDNTLVEILNDVEPIPLSAEMALLSELPISKIAADESLDFAWKRHCSNFGIGTQSEMRRWSHIDELVNAVKEVVSKEKDKILFAKPLNAILAAGDSIKSVNENALIEHKTTIEDLQKPDSELDEKEYNLSKAHRRLEKKIDSLGDDLDTEIQNLIRKGRNELEDMVDSACQNMRNVIENEWGRLKSIDSILPRLDGIVQKLLTRDLKRATQNLAEDGKRKIKACISGFFADAEDVFMRYLPDFNSREFVKRTQNRVQMELADKELFTVDTNQEADANYGWGDFFGEFAYGFLTGITFGGWMVVSNALTHDDLKKEALSKVNAISSGFEPDPYLESAFASKDAVIEQVKAAFISEMIERLQSNLQKVRDKKSNKEAALREAQEKLGIEEKKRADLEKQFEEINRIKGEA